MIIPCVEDLRENKFMGLGIGDSFQHTSDLKFYKYKETMVSPDKNKFVEEVETEHEEKRWIVMW